MSNAARKARKRTRHSMLEHRGTTVGDRLLEAFAFRHPAKTGTPVADRADNQARPYYRSASISGNRPTGKARRRIADAEARSAADGQGTTWPDHRRASRA